MASRIQGITVEIGGDTTKLSKALESVNKSIKGTQSGLKDVNKLLKLDPSNTELVVQKQKMLKDAIEATKEKLATLKTAAQQANEQLANGEITQQQYDALQREIVETEQNLRSLQDQAATTNATLAKIDEAGEKLQNIGSSVENVGKKFLPVTAAVTGLGTAAVKTAADFDSEMSKVSAISGATGDNLLDDSAEFETFQTQHYWDIISEKEAAGEEFIDIEDMYGYRPVSLERAVKCPHCGHEENVDLEDFMYDESSYEKENGMGPDLVYSFNSEDCYECPECGHTLKIEGWIREYPMGAYDSEDIKVEDTSCLKKFEDVEYVELLLNSVDRCVAIRPCEKGNPNAIHWGRLKEGRWCASTLGCRGLAKTLFDIMEWEEGLKYRFRGQFVEQGDNKLMLFELDEPEMIKIEEIVLPSKEEEAEGKTVKQMIYIFPPEWAGTFGQPITSIAQVGILQQEHYAGNWDVLRPAAEIKEMNTFTADGLNALLHEAEEIMEGWTDTNE